MTTPFCRCETALALADAATDVVETWEHGDLAAAVRNLDQARQSFDLGFIGDYPCCPPAIERYGAASGVPDTASRFSQAMALTRPHVCDPAGIALALLAVCRAARLDNVAPATDPAVRLIACKLASICSASAEREVMTPLIMECQSSLNAARKAEVRHD